MKRRWIRGATNFCIKFYRKWVLGQIFKLYTELIPFLLNVGYDRVVLFLLYCSFLRWKRLYLEFEKKNIKGFLVNGKEIKTTLFADDMTCFLRDTNSYFQLLTSLQNYARYSGLCINNEKKKKNRDFAIGPHSLVQDVFTHKIGSMIKLLGLYFNYDNEAQRARACSPIAKKIYPSSKIW